MAKLRNITPHTLETRLNGRNFVTEPDAILDLPDDLYGAYAWPDSIWAEIDVPHTEKKPRKTAAHEEN